MTDEQIAHRAYETWDTYGGRALGAWHGPYTKDAWLEVVKTVREAIETEATAQ